jgi:hypothetical protein
MLVRSIGRIARGFAILAGRASLICGLDAAAGVLVSIARALGRVGMLEQV